jgi:NAD(P)-dependent dehydrogenase (short-subunit alcohol dehydrogenase family)
MAMKSGKSKDGPFTVVITGGAQGIGRVMAGAFLAEGYRVAVWDYDQEAVKEERERMAQEGNYMAWVCDVAMEEEVERAVQATLDQFGRIDVLVNNAAIEANKPVEELEPAEWRRVLEVNLTGPFLCTRACEAELRKNFGRVINLCSTRAFQSERDTEAYSASKGGVYALTHALAISLSPDVRVNSISPGWIDVSAIRKRSRARQASVTFEDHAQHPAGKVGEGEDIARMALFLADHRNSFITGQNFIVDGGMTRKMIYL